MNGDRLQRTAKALHLIGLALFLGSILGHALLSAVPGAGSDAKTTLVTRQAIEIATSYLTLPGLALLVVSGLFMTVRGGYGFGRLRWLTLHQILALIIIANAAFVLLPTGNALIAVTKAWVAGGTGADFQAVAPREAIAGGINILLAIVTVFIAAIRPRLGSRV